MAHELVWGGSVWGTEATQGLISGQDGACSQHAQGAGQYLLEALIAHRGPSRESDRAGWRWLWIKASGGWGRSPGPVAITHPCLLPPSYLRWEVVLGHLAPQCPPGPVGRSLPGVWLGGRGFWGAAWGRQATLGGGPGWQQRHLGDTVPWVVCPVARWRVPVQDGPTPRIPGWGWAGGDSLHCLGRYTLGQVAQIHSHKGAGQQNG